MAKAISNGVPSNICQFCKGTGRYFHWKSAGDSDYSTIYCDCPLGDYERAEDVRKEKRP